MNRARVVVACGVLVLLLGFGVGTERTLSVDAAGAAYDCGSAIPAWSLLTGTRAPGDGPGTAGTEQQARAEACAPVLREARLWVAAVMGLGGAVALAGLAAVDRRRSTPPQPSRTPEVASESRRSY
ncbi:hypothetical protein KDN32_14740 [Nocardioides sp. J2M5]|uniref:hypothetical protein n=1 Tax=Nocardioides palaemonis TaxID=2829810 RepID=UPI001BAAF7EC|nr:hypothetical protein [Nocardioides palaemonis]MBS2938994.1 hypothetical protein [Nocardioides palaemonis]